MKKLVSLFLAVTILCTLAVAPAFADDFETSDCYQTLQELINNSFAETNFGLPTYEYNAEQNVVYITFVAPAGSVEALTNGKAAVIESWNTMVGAMLNLSQVSVEFFAAYGFDTGCAIMLQSDVNEEMYIYLCLNGEELYNLATEE